MSNLKRLFPGMVRGSSRGGRPPTPLSPTINHRDYRAKCARLLAKYGWIMDAGEGSETAVAQKVYEGMVLQMVLLFLEPGGEYSSARRADWAEVRAHAQGLIVLIAYSPPSAELIQYADETRIKLFSYFELHNFERFCGKIPFHFRGAVDCIVHPSRIRGWVLSRSHERLFDGVSLKVLKKDEWVAKGVPDHPRPGVSGDKDYLSGFDIDCGDKVSAEDLISGSVTVIALDQTGARIKLGIWEQAIDDLRSQVSAKQRTE